MTLSNLRQPMGTASSSPALRRELSRAENPVVRLPSSLLHSAACQRLVVTKLIPTEECSQYGSGESSSLCREVFESKKIDAQGEDERSAAACLEPLGSQRGLRVR